MFETGFLVEHYHGSQYDEQNRKINYIPPFDFGKFGVVVISPPGMPGDGYENRSCQAAHGYPELVVRAENLCASDIQGADRLYSQTQDGSCDQGKVPQIISGGGNQPGERKLLRVRLGGDGKSDDFL